MVVAGLAALAIVGAHAGLIPMGRWQVDEYRLFTTLRQFGAGALPVRLLYSPRPFSEFLIFLYGEAVLHLHRPLVTSFLAVVWTGLIASTGLAAYTALPRSAWRLPLALAFTFALVATALTGADVTEAFYWPVAAAAYMPTLAAGLCLFFLTDHPMNRRRRAMSGTALAVAAGSTEVGAAFALCFALTIAAERLWAVLRHRIRPVAALSASAWWLIPGVIGLLVLLAILRLRYGLDELGAANARYTGHDAAAVFAALRELAAELTSRERTAARMAVRSHDLRQTPVHRRLRGVLAARRAGCRPAGPGPCRARGGPVGRSILQPCRSLPALRTTLLRAAAIGAPELPGTRFARPGYRRACGVALGEHARASHPDDAAPDFWQQESCFPCSGGSTG